MSSTSVLDRPARQASPGSLAPSLPLARLTEPSTESSLASASGSAPALADLLFDFEIPSTPSASPSDGSEAPAAVQFTIDTFDKASWAASRILSAQTRIAQRTELAQAYRVRIDAWLSSSNKADEDTLAYLSVLLKPFIESELSRSHSRSRTLHLPTASASLRKSPDHVSVLDEAAAMAYLESNHPSAIVTKRTISLSTLRTLVFTEGEAVPGVEASLGSDTLHIKPIG